jgi:hypothetical protein
LSSNPADKVSDMVSPRCEAAKAAIPVLLTASFLILMHWYLGIDLGDDSIYMHDGIPMGLSSLILVHDWAPLYSLWFKVLLRIVRDPVVCYFVSWGLIVTAISLVPTLFRRRAAWLYTLIILPLPYMVASKFVGLFASAFLVTGLCWLLGKRLSFAETLCADCILMFVVSFCRPEYDNGVLLCAIATIVAVIVEQLTAKRRVVNDIAAPASKQPAWLQCGTVVVLSLMVIYVVRNQIPSHRSGMAFAQHFNVRSALKGLIPLTPDTWRSNYAELQFGIDTDKNALTGTATIGQFIRANPRLFLSHIGNNLHDPRALLLGAYVLAVVTLPWWLKGSEEFRPASLFVLFLCIPPVAGSVIIFPNPHYAAVIVPPLTLFALQVLNPERWLSPSVPFALAVGLALLLYAYVVPHNSPNVPFSLERQNLYRLQCVRSLDAKAPKSNVSAFSITEITPVFIEPSRTLRFAYTFQNWNTFQSWMTSTKPAWVSVDDDRSALYGAPSLAQRFGVPPGQIDWFLRNTLGYTPHPCEAQAQLTVYTLDHP